MSDRPEARWRSARAEHTGRRLHTMLNDDAGVGGGRGVGQWKDRNGTTQNGHSIYGTIATHWLTRWSETHTESDPSRFVILQPMMVWEVKSGGEGGGRSSGGAADSWNHAQ